MMSELTSILREPVEAVDLPGNVKVTRDDWLKAAMDILVSEGVEQVKVLTISERLGVSRSSFYWYFKSRRTLLDNLLDDWERTNTSLLVSHCEMPADTITEAVCHFFRCFIDPELFDQRLDFAVREWARNDGTVRSRIDRADKRRLSAIASMFARHGYGEYEADVRARILYFMQLGYHALDHSEPMEERISRLEGYLLGFTGREALPAEVEAMRAFARHNLGKP